MTVRDDEALSANPRSKSPLTASVCVSAAGVLVGWGITWGTYSQRLESLETAAHRADERTDRIENLIFLHDRQLAEQRAQFQEILRRLERIEGKLELREQ